MKIFTLVFLLSVASFARLTDEQFEIKIKKNQINITTKKGYHLNVEAPATAVFDNLEAVFKPTLKTEKLFSFKKDEKAEKGTLGFYICDDKKTVCEQHKQALQFKNNEIKKMELRAEYNHIKDFNLESTNGKATLLVFSAPWCPACIRMQTETYNKPEVQKQIERLNFVKLNSDVVDNFELSEKFKVRAIPTMILLNKRGQEASRWLDFQDSKGFAKSLSAELKKVDHSEEILKKAQLGDSSAASALAFKAYNTLDYAEAYKWFLLTKSENDQKYKLASEVSLAQEKEDEKSADDYLLTLQKAIVLTTSKLDQLRWSIDFFEKKKERNALTEEAKLKAKAIVTELNGLLKNSKLAKISFFESTYGNYNGFEKEELLWMKSRLYRALDMVDEKAKTDKESIELITNKKLTDSKPGEVLLAISYLKEAGETKKVENLYERLVKKYPNTYVYFEKYARFVQKNKNLERALALTNEALKFPEGNEPQLKLLKSQILKGLNKKSEAIAVIDETLKIDYIQHKRFAGTRKRLSELKEELSKQNNE